MDAKTVKQVTDTVMNELEKEFEKAKQYKPEMRDWLSSYWAGYNSPHQHSRIRNTGVKMDLLKEVGSTPRRWYKRIVHAFSHSFVTAAKEMVQTDGTRSFPCYVLISSAVMHPLNPNAVLQSVVSLAVLHPLISSALLHPLISSAVLHL